MASSVETAAIRRNFTQQREARMSHLKGQWQKEENNSSERSNYPHLCLLMGGRGEKKCFSKKKKKMAQEKMAHPHCRLLSAVFLQTCTFGCSSTLTIQ